VLSYVRRLGLLPRLTSDDLRDGPKKLSTGVAHRLPQPAELRKLLEAALRHDAETFAATREEHAGLRPPGTTRRYQQIAPLIAGAVLTGMRFGELVDLDWKNVELEALDHDGEKAGESS
jgi:integrase